MRHLMWHKTRVLTLCIAVGASLALAGCDEDEQGRILRYEKGTYLGPPDTALTEDQLGELRARAKRQAGD